MNESIDLNKIKRIVFKFGTNVLKGDDGNISQTRIESFVDDISKLHAVGKEILIVTSGAVGLGKKKLGIENTDYSIALKQACAAVGQGKLISIWENDFIKKGITTAQILLTEDDFSSRTRYLNLSNVLNTLLELKTIPIINQNDTVSSKELEAYQNVSFSDNDKLSALVASRLNADLLVILSDIDGLYDDNPKVNSNAKFIDLVEEITEEVEHYAQNASKGGRGGMKTKLEAAKVVTRSGGTVIIANGKTPQILKTVFEQEHPVGTTFLPTENLSGKKRWVAYATNIQGQLVVNDGAKKAILEKESSLLPIGVLKINNDFQKGDVISILDQNGTEFARGVINYNCSDCKKIIGLHSEKIVDVLGYKNYNALITRDNIAIL